MQCTQPQTSTGLHSQHLKTLVSHLGLNKSKVQKPIHQVVCTDVEAADVGGLLLRRFRLFDSRLIFVRVLQVLDDERGVAKHSITVRYPWNL